MDPNAPPRILTLQQPRTLAFGAGCADACAGGLRSHGRRRVLIVSGRSTRPIGAAIADSLTPHRIEARVWAGVTPEPTIDVFRQGLAVARDLRADAVVGI